MLSFVKLRNIFLVMSLFLHSIVFSYTDCQYVSVKNLQAQHHNILIRVTNSNGNSFWKVLAPYDAKFTSSFQAIAQQALANKASVILRFEPDNYDCSKNDYGTVPLVIRL